MPTNEAVTLTADDFKYDNFHTVHEGRLYRSAQIPAARLSAYIEKFNIKTVINLRSAAERFVCCRGEEEAAAKSGANVVYAPLSASRASTKEELQRLLAIFDKEQEPFLIHCSQGINRTGEACALWLLDKAEASNEKALLQFDKKFGYVFSSRPEKYLLILVWQGRDWLCGSYNPDALGKK